ncbi:hypothetical protein MBRA_02231 [Methylobacterium brachiatum]|nr:hypothetical protein MBRA_02231 [Methylobacterium brachiatum]
MLRILPVRPARQGEIREVVEQPVEDRGGAAAPGDTQHQQAVRGLGGVEIRSDSIEADADEDQPPPGAEPEDPAGQVRDRQHRQRRHTR